MTGDAAESWTLAGGGQTITFTLRKGITFHDGKPLTSKDVAYNIDRAWKPRSPRMTEFKDQLNALEKIETPDDYTVKLTLARPSNFLLSSMASNQFLIYPAHMPLPQFDAEWKDKGTGSGPFKVSSIVADAKIETVRNPNYFRQGLPYLDGITFNAINDDSLVVAGYRAGRLDAMLLDFTPLQKPILEGVLQREVGLTSYPMVNGGQVVHIVQRQPFTDPKVREAVNLAINRREVFQLAFDSLGSPYASPLLPPEMGGKWGILLAEMKNKPGYRDDKTQDLARAKQLLAEAGVDPSKVRLRILVSTAQSIVGESAEPGLRALGFKPEIITADTGQKVDLATQGAFEVLLDPVVVQVDDPSDFLASWVKTGGAFNYAKWSDPELDKMLDDQDRTVDVARRTQLARQIQDRVLSNNQTTMLVWRTINIGHNKFVKNYPGKIPFTSGPRFRWEQVWVER